MQASRWRRHPGGHGGSTPVVGLGPTARPVGQIVERRRRLSARPGPTTDGRPRSAPRQARDPPRPRASSSPEPGSGLAIGPPIGTGDRARRRRRLRGRTRVAEQRPHVRPRAEQARVDRVAPSLSTHEEQRIDLGAHRVQDRARRAAALDRDRYPRSPWRAHVPGRRPGTCTTLRVCVGSSSTSSVTRPAMIASASPDDWCAIERQAGARHRRTRRRGEEWHRDRGGDQAGSPTRPTGYSTVTDLARFRGWSTSRPRSTATWYASSCRARSPPPAPAARASGHLEDVVRQPGDLRSPADTTAITSAPRAFTSWMLETIFG